MKHYLSDALLLIIMFLSINAIQTYFHESIHKDICENFGGSAEIKYNLLFQGGKTECTASEGGAYHALNDIVSYNVSIIVIAIFMLMIFLAMHFSKKRIQ